MTDQETVEVAKMIATNAHRGQYRWGGEDFITHPAAVAEAVRPLGAKYEAAAWLHDVLEDTDTKASYLVHRGIPKEVVEAVKLLTHSPKLSYLDYLKRLMTAGSSEAGGIAIQVKLADLRHNQSTCDGNKERTKAHALSLIKWQLAEYILENS